MKKIILLIVLLFTFSLVEAQTYLQENFDTEIPATWTVTDEGGATGDSWISGQQGAGNALNGTNCAIVNSDANGNGVELIETLTSPVFDTTGATALFLDFDQFYNNGGGDSAIVEVFDGTNWIEVLNQNADAGGFDNPDQQHIDITAYSNASMQIRFIYNDGNIWAWYWLVDNVEVYNSTCNFPSALEVTAITANSADISWTAGGTETDWEIVIQPAGSGEPSGSGTPTTDNPYSVTDLTALTDYEVYIRANCGTDGFSPWVGPVNFQSACDVFIPEYVENFETIVPDCWDEATDGDATTGPVGLGEGAWVADGFLNNGFTGAYKVNLWQNFKSDWILTPQFDLTGGPFQVDFDFGIMEFGSPTEAGTLGSDDTVELLISTDNGVSWTNLMTWDNTSVVPATGTQVVADLTAYSGQTVQFGILASEGTVDDTEDNDVFVDNFRVRLVPTCQEPTGITVDNITAFTADISWTPGGTETNWEVVVQPVGTGLPTGPGTATANNPYTVTGLDAITDYEIYVRADCGGTDGLSSWIGPVNFQTACAVFVPDYLEDFTTIIPDCWDEAGDGDAVSGPTNLGAGDWGPDGFLNNGFTGAYKINLWQAFKSDWILSPQFDLTGGPFQVDFDFGIMQFGSPTEAGTLGSDDTVELLISTDNGATWTNLLTWDNTSVVPASGTLVVYDLSAYSGQTVQFGILGSEGTVDDTADNDIFVDNFRVRAIPDCPEPTGLIVENVTGTTADFSWEAGASETDWEYVVQPEGSGEPTGAGTPVTTMTVNETGLDYDTDYEVWVRADCDVNGFSAWTGPVIFETDLLLDYIVDCAVGPVNTNFCYFDDIDDDPSVATFTYTSSNGLPLNLDFNAGDLEGCCDELVVIDSDGTELFNSTLNNAGLADVSGLSFQSSGDTISWYINSDFSVSCDSSTGFTPFDVTVSCATCINPAATYQIVDDCDNGEQFLINVNVTSMGDATSLTISSNIDANTVPATAVGTYEIGPFPFFVDVVITVTNDQDASCDINSSAFQLLACPPDNDNPCNATVAGVNADESCDIITSGTLVEATDSGVPSGSCNGDPGNDVWFEFTALDEFQIIQFTNIDGSDFFLDLDHGVYEGTCDGLVELYCSDADASITPSLTVGNTYYIRAFSAGNDPVDYTFDLCIRPGAGNVMVDQDTYTIEELVVDILIDSPCAQISNITFSTGTNFGDVNGIGYFSAFDGGFPFEEGLLLTSGNAALAAGPNINDMGDGTFAWPGDDDLSAIIGGDITNNASIIEFDFVPLSDEISFDFLMASEEYNGNTGGTFECNFSDAFAFLLTDENGVTTNLAVLPGTNTPILVTNIHPENPGCDAINEEYFGGYVPDNLPPMSFDGRTEVFTAFSEVNIGETYHIKLVIADEGDSNFDSGVFLKAGSFDIGEVELGADITIASGTAACLGQQITLETQAPAVDHVWFKDGFVIEGETTNTLIVEEPGSYTTQIIFSPTCIISDDILVEFLPLPIANMPPDLVGCSIGNDTAVFNLPDNDLAILGDTQSPDDFTVTYHLTEQDAIDGVSPLVSPYTSVSDPQTVYAQVTNNTTGCTNTTSFDLVLGIEPETTFTQDFDYEVCPNATVPVIITATPVNYTAEEVTINWYLDGVLQTGENGLTFPVLIAGDYEIEVIFNDTGCSSIASQTVIELESCVIPQGISPNGDGMNDTFDLSSYRVSKLEIFNRLGTLVYSKTNYVDEWYGQTNDGEELPVGTYFYTMEYEDGKQRSAWVYIQRLN
ncbi:choice-of-anchor L domain-containing protein [Psychroserpens sp. SPM9]|uniref:choice-of-anchor L domain-containing protein n=1 Tax=Psychroserpens sp. SPM9 TaxID=2975598 RepID=UPI0021A39DCF|nr:choice-of-anchor L domain-containing protein [Psychroserpens sp. SPM9]MDG5490910.1 choice-of-anchor L domain-containing protein [Psychroserpens sp. SPM9]